LVRGINDGGHMVGQVSKQDGSGSSVALWLNPTTRLDLQSLTDPNSGLTVLQAPAINNADQIVVIAKDNHGEAQVVLLDRSDQPVSSCTVHYIPENATRRDERTGVWCDDSHCL